MEDKKKALSVCHLPWSWAVAAGSQEPESRASASEARLPCSSSLARSLEGTTDFLTLYNKNWNNYLIFSWFLHKKKWTRELCKWCNTNKINSNIITGISKNAHCTDFYSNYIKVSTDWVTLDCNKSLKNLIAMHRKLKTTQKLEIPGNTK
jgi:hypothetical protein